jgi:5-hydroxyisourate hydrolase-like protein (transthyretin family)
MLSPFLICLTLITGAFAQDNQPPKKTEAVAAPAVTGMVAGRIVYEDTGQPATRHRVQLIAAEALFSARNGLRIPTAITNERGEFSLPRVSAGEYYVFAGPLDQLSSPTDLLSVLTRSVDPATDAANLERFKKNNPRITVDGQRSVEVNLRVPNSHFGTISGTVFDATHQPAVRAMVHIMRKGSDSFGKSAITDDQGRYKVWGLPKGEYIVSVSPPAQEKSDRERPMNIQGSLGATYFPSTLVSLNSPPVAVLPDLDTANVDVTLISRALRNLSGTVRMRADHSPVANAMLRLSVRPSTDSASDTSRTAGVENAMTNYLSSTDNDGHWSIANVPDGSYRLFVQPRQNDPLKPRFVQLEKDLVVDGTNIEDFLIEVSEGVRLSGVVVLEGNSASPQFTNVSVSSYKLHANSNARIDEAGKFALTGVPTGEIVVSAFVYPQDKFYVKSIEANGQDLLRTNMTIAEGDEIKDVRIVVSSGVGVITGRVLSQTGDKPVAGVNVMLRRTGDDKPRLYGGKISALTDERGVFTLSAAPGNYLVIAWRSADGPPALDTAMSKADREQGAAGVTLLPSSRKELDIRLP